MDGDEKSPLSAVAVPSDCPPTIEYEHNQTAGQSVAENNRLRRVKGMTFSDLPIELRIHIWRCCLPQRVRGTKQVTRSNADFEQDYAHLSVSPLAHVCREAREVALEHGSFYTNAGRWPWNSWQRVWVDPSRDLIYINAYFSQVALAEPGHIMALTKKANTLAMHHPFLKHGAGNIFHPNGNTVMADQLCQHMIVCEDQFTVTATYEQAVQSGLFGMWAEKRILLVSLFDEEMLAAVTQLPCSHSDTEWFDGLPYKPPTRQTREAPARRLAAEPQRYGVADCICQSRMDAIRHSVEECWLACHKHLARTPDGEIDHSSSIFDGPFVVGHRRNHPWVKTMLKKMPKLDIAVCFNLRMEDDRIGNMTAVSDEIEAAICV